MLFLLSGHLFIPPKFLSSGPNMGTFLPLEVPPGNCGTAFLEVHSFWWDSTSSDVGAFVTSWSVDASEGNVETPCLAPLASTCAH